MKKKNSNRFAGATPSLTARSVPAQALAAGLAATLLSMPLHAADTALSSVPLTTASSVQAKPNIMFILDGSGSMDSAYMPDDAKPESRGESYAFRSSQCNGVAYDPSYDYTANLPWKSDGTGRYPSLTGLTAVPVDGFSASSQKTDLSGDYYYTYNSSANGSAPRMGWTYTSTNGRVDTTTDFYKQCKSAIDNSPGKSYFTKVLVSSLPADKQVNYANWYAYFHTRMLMMRTAAGQAFYNLDEKYRVGFTTIDSTDVADSSNFLDINDFGATQKQTFLTRLYGRAPNSATPLRASLSKVGRYYANKITGQNDPVQYSCQRNYAILSTDGYWNTDNEKNGYQPYQLDGSTMVGQQDGSVARPQYDGAQTTSTVTKTWTRYNWVVSSKVGDGKKNNCSTSTYSTQITPQTLTETIVTTNGTVTSDTTDKNWTNGTTASSCKTAAQLTSMGASAGTSGNSTSNTQYISTTDGILTVSDPRVVSSGGSTNSLADVAQYYYMTDLRNQGTQNNCSGRAVDGAQNDVCANDVPTTDRDTANWQHMTTSTIGLGVSGTLTYDPAYLTQKAGDYVGLVQGTKNWPVPTETTTGGDARNIDDLWHAAVNGRGRYFSAQNASDLVNAISLSLSAATAVTGAASAAATNSLKPVSGDNNQAFIATYRTVDWTGDVRAFPLDASTGNVDVSSPAWSAQAKLDTKAASARTIYYRRPNGALQSFTYANLNTDGYGGNFSGFCTKTAAPTQCGSGMSDPNKTLANDGANLVNFLRGDGTYEATNSTSPLYRSRAHKLGDIIGGAPAFVGAPPFSYTDTGYSTYKSNNSTRQKVLYAAANDGMLHAFAVESTGSGNNAIDAGSELWAFVPTEVMPDLYRLADTDYGNKHRYFVDGAPVVGDIQVNNNWKTILVGGLGAGGKSYYALDVSNPTSPVALWEFSNANLGYTLGNPIITKRKDGTWVVVIASGYNNNAGGGDGLGHLFVLNAATGQLLLDLPTTAGSVATPSGLAKINAWVDDPTNNTAIRFYGGDLQGNLWRFDTDDLVGTSGREAMLLAQFMLNSDPTTPQPITTAPQPVTVKSNNTNYAVVIVGTGSYLGSNDVGTTTQQSLYAVKDALTSTGIGDARANAGMVDRAITFASTDATSGSIASGTLDWATKVGWKVDLPKSGERLVTDMVVQYNTLAAVTAIPGSSVCTPSGGSSWLYLLDVETGTASDSVTAASSYLGAFLGVGITWLQTTNGDGKLEIVGSDGSITTKGAGGSSGGSGTLRRTSWRELVD
ncbi:MAG: pilus assembly protein PilY [Variovorax sp.]|nr:pilus assembly protein PilY [Variovorax sp.]